MHSNISYLLNSIWRKIPPQILHYAFVPSKHLSINRGNIDWTIRDKVIDGWILQDINVVAGQETTLDLRTSTIRETESGAIAEIPLRETGGRFITSALSVIYSLSSTYLPRHGSEIANAASGPVQVSHSRTMLVGPNTIFVEGGIMSGTRYLRCIIENDPDFNNIQKASMKNLADLAVVACKAHIYNETQIRNTEATIIHGISYSKINDTIEGWSDASEIYDDMLKKWKKIAYMQDRESHKRYIKAIMPS